jgi:hypothetical protein
MRADFGALFQHDHRQVGIGLLQPDGGGEACRARSDDHHVEFHAFAFAKSSRDATGFAMFPSKL